MQKDILENFEKMTQLTLDNFRKLGETNLKTGEKLLKEQVELTNALLETATENAQCAAGAKDFKDAASQQAEWAQDWAQRVLESTRACADILAEAGKVYTGIFEAGMKTAASSEKTGKARKAA